MPDPSDPQRLLSHVPSAGEHRRVAVKVIDPRGNEVMRMHHRDGKHA